MFNNLLALRKRRSYRKGDFKQFSGMKAIIARDVYASPTGGASESHKIMWLLAPGVDHRPLYNKIFLSPNYRYLSYFEDVGSYCPSKQSKFEFKYVESSDDDSSDLL